LEPLVAYPEFFSVRIMFKEQILNVMNSIVESGFALSWKRITKEEFATFVREQRRPEKPAQNETDPEFGIRFIFIDLYKRSYNASIDDDSEDNSDAFLRLNNIVLIFYVLLGLWLLSIVGFMVEARLFFKVKTCFLVFVKYSIENVVHCLAHLNLRCHWRHLQICSWVNLN